MQPTRSRPALCALAALVLGCSDNATEPDDTGTPPPVGSSAEATIPPDGGSLNAMTAGGIRVGLTFPPGSLRSPETISLTLLEPNGESWLRFSLLPAGLELAEPATFRVTVPDGESVPVGSSLYLDAGKSPVFHPTHVDDGFLEARVSMFGFDGPASDGVDRLEGAPATGGVSPATCTALQDAAEEAAEIFFQVTDYAKAFAFYQAYQSLAAAAACPLDSEQWVATSTALACSGYAAAKENADVTLTANYDQLYDVLEPLVIWASVAAAFECPTFDSDAFVTTMEEKYEQFITFYGSEVEAVDVGDFTTYKKLREEAKELIRLWEQAETLGLQDQAQALAQSVFMPFVTALRAMAYGKCHEDRDHYFLTKLILSEFFSGADVLPTGPELRRTLRSVLFPFDDEAIQHDLQYCASDVTLRSYWAADVPGGRGGAMDVQVLGSLGTPGEATIDGDVDVDPSGALVLSGDLTRFVCFPPSQNAGDLLRVTLNGTTVATVPNPAETNLLHEDVLIDMGSAFAAIGDEPSPGDTYTLRVYRQRTACSKIVFGPPEFLLFDVELTAVAAELGDVWVDTQAEVNLLAGVTQVNSLTIAPTTGPSTDITDLSALSSLVHVETQLLIANNPALTSLSGLDNLTHVGGLIEIFNNAGLGSLTGLGSLASTINLTVQSCASLASLSGLSLPSALPNAQISLDNCPQLTDLSALSNVTQLHNLKVSDIGITTFAGLSGLTQSQNLWVSDCPNLTALDGLQSCDVERFVTILNNPVLTSIGALSGVTGHASTRLVIDGNPNLTTLDGLENVTQCWGFGIYRNASLTSLAALSNVTMVEGGFGVGENPALASLDGLQSLTDAGVSLSIRDNDNLTSIAALDAVASAQDVLIEGNPSLTSLTGLGGLALRLLQITDNEQLTSLAGLQGVSVSHDLLVNYNDALTSLSGLDAVTALAWNLRIEYNPVLASLAGLQALTSVGENVTIYGNGALDNCVAQDFAAGIAVGGTTSVSNNGPCEK